MLCQEGEECANACAYKIMLTPMFCLSCIVRSRCYFWTYLTIKQNGSEMNSVPICSVSVINTNWSINIRYWTIMSNFDQLPSNRPPHSQNNLTSHCWPHSPFQCTKCYAAAARPLIYSCTKKLFKKIHCYWRQPPMSDWDRTKYANGAYKNAYFTNILLYFFRLIRWLMKDFDTIW